MNEIESGSEEDIFNDTGGSFTPELRREVLEGYLELFSLDPVPGLLRCGKAEVLFSPPM